MRKHFSLTNGKVLQSEKCGSTLSWPLRKHFNLPDAEILIHEETFQSDTVETLKGTVQPEWISMRVEPLDRH
jgi:hypothetical protein